MRNLFKRNDNDNKEVVEDKNIKLYLSYMKEFYGLIGLSLDEEDKVKLTDEFNNSLNYFVSYLENTFSDDVLVGSNSISIDEDAMLMGASNEAKNLFCKHKYNKLIYINSSDTYPHMHTDGEYVVEMEGVHTIKGLNQTLQKNSINQIFNGLTIPEAAALLEQMRLLGKDGELRQAIATHNVLEMVRRLFYNAIISKVLDSESKMKVTRARLFADTFGVKYDFSKYENEDVKYTLKKDNN